MRRFHVFVAAISKKAFVCVFVWVAFEPGQFFLTHFDLGCVKKIVVAISDCILVSGA